MHHPIITAMGMDVFLVTTSTTLAEKFFICVSQMRHIFFKDNIWENIAHELDYLLFCLLRWSVKLSHRQPLLRPEPAVFQLFYEVRLFVSVPKTFAVSCQNFFVNSFSCVYVGNWCSGQCDEFWYEHFASDHFAFPCHFFVSHPVCQGL